MNGDLRDERREPGPGTENGSGPAPSKLSVDTLKASDRDFALAAFRAWELDCHGFRGEKAWRVMAEIVCSDAEHVEKLAIRDGGEPVAFIIVLTQPGEFWPAYLARLGPGALVRQAFGSVAGFLGRMTAARTGSGAEGEAPADPEFAELARGSHRTRPGVAWGLFGYVDPGYRKPPTALLMYRKMFARLREKGFARLEGQIRFGNDESVAYHRALGFDIRNAGWCLHAVKTLEPAGHGPSRVREEGAAR